MKTIKIARNIYTDKSTIGDLFFDGEFICSSLEDTIRNVKLAKKTAIPAGDYTLEIRHSNKFNRDMPFLLDVPYFEGIMIHWGNSDIDTDGCILVGAHDIHQSDWIGSSRKAFEKLYALIEVAHKVGEEVRVGILGGLRKEYFIEAKKGI